jgi:hypothetical protein
MVRIYAETSHRDPMKACSLEFGSRKSENARGCEPGEPRREQGLCPYQPRDRSQHGIDRSSRSRDPGEEPQGTAGARKEEGPPETEPDPRIDDEYGVTVEPAAVERHEPSHAVVVQPVERRMGRDREEAETEESFEAGTAESECAVQERESAGEEERPDGDSGKAMGPASPEVESEVGAHEIGDPVDVREVRAEDECGEGEAGSLFEPALRKRRADQRVGDGVHA